MENFKLFLAVLLLQVFIASCFFGVGYKLGNRRGFNEGYKSGQSALFLEMTIHDSKTVQRFAKARLVSQAS